MPTLTQSYSQSQEVQGLSVTPLSNDESDALSILERKLEKFDPNMPEQLSYADCTLRDHSGHNREEILTAGPTTRENLIRDLDPLKIACFGRDTDHQF